MAKKYIFLGKLSISSKLLNFVNDELLPGTGITKENFWSGLDKYAHELAPKNRKLLEFRENLQKKIDVWHRDKKTEKIDIKEYLAFITGTTSCGPAIEEISLSTFLVSIINFSPSFFKYPISDKKVEYFLISIFFAF